jgi:hypothetical protein
MELPKEKIENLREISFEHCSIHFHAEFDGMGVFYIVRKNKEDGKYWYNGKKGDIKDLHVFVSNDDNSNYLTYKDQKEEDFYKYTFFMEEDAEDIYSLDIIGKLEPLLVGEYLGANFYFKHELATGTPTDETNPMEFIEHLKAFNKIRRAVYGVPHWDEPIKQTT